MLVKTPKGKIEVELYKDDAGLNEDPLFYRVIAFSKDKQEMSHINFSIQPRQRIWIYHIATKPQFQHMGLATALSKVMEYFVTTVYNVNYAEGKYAPSNDYAKDFYNKNDYEIWVDDYKHYISKSLDKQKIIQEAKPLIEGEIEIKDYQEYKRQKESQKIVQNLKERYPNITQQEQKITDVSVDEQAKELKI